jgi:phage shock protein C
VNDRLYRSRNERLLAGVAGGVAERFDLDPSIVRVLWVLLVILSGGIFLLLYIAMALVVPEAPDGSDRWGAWGVPPTPAARSDTPAANIPPTDPGQMPPPPPAPAGTSWSGPPSGWRPRQRRTGNGGGAIIAGIVLVLVGGYFLLRTLVPQVHLGAFWPLVLVGVGVALVVGSIRPGSGGSGLD